jgi:hypothetical protein
MTTIARAMRPWTVCFSCGSALQPEHRWVDDDGLLCRECANRRRIEYIKRSEPAYGAMQKGIRSHLFAEAGGAR